MEALTPVQHKAQKHVLRVRACVRVLTPFLLPSFPASSCLAPNSRDGTVT